MTNQARRDKAVEVVLIHSPLIGPDSWGPCAHTLQSRGLAVTIPDLTPTIETGPPYWPAQVSVVSEATDGPAVLVGHSGAGSLLPAISKAVAGIRGYLFVDAGLPVMEKSWMDTVPPEMADNLKGMAIKGWLPPWPQWWDSDVIADLVPDDELRERLVRGCRSLPMAMFEEVFPEIPDWPNAPCAYLQLSEAYTGSAEEARLLGWPVTAIQANHLAIYTKPEDIADKMLPLLQSMGAA